MFKAFEKPRLRLEIPGFDEKCLKRADPKATANKSQLQR